MYKQDLPLNNQQWLICHKTQTNQLSSGGEVSVLEISIMLSPPSLSLLRGQLKGGVVVPDKAPSKAHKGMFDLLTVCQQMTDLNSIVFHSNSRNHLTVQIKLLVLDSNT